MYDASFYDVSRDGMRLSASVLVPFLMDRLGMTPDESIIDVGCGEGWWAAEFAGYEMTAVGLDGDYVDAVGGIEKISHNLNLKLPVLGPFDYALSLEVAEHLQGRRGKSFVQDLCNLAPVVIFSAAIPRQGGTGHVNEQWPSYWAGHFRSAGYRVTGAFRFDIWNDDRIENWYRQNLLIAWDPNMESPPADEEDECLPFVHPVLWKARQG